MCIQYIYIQNTIYCTYFQYFLLTQSLHLIIFLVYHVKCYNTNTITVPSKYSLHIYTHRKSTQNEHTQKTCKHVAWWRALQRFQRLVCIQIHGGSGRSDMHEIVYLVCHMSANINRNRNRNTHTYHTYHTSHTQLIKKFVYFIYFLFSFSYFLFFFYLSLFFCCSTLYFSLIRIFQIQAMYCGPLSRRYSLHHHLPSKYARTSSVAYAENV